MNDVVALLVVVAVAGALRYVHVRLFPMKVCPGCGGSRRRPGGGTTFAVCGRCGGRGEVRRWGARKGN